MNSNQIIQRTSKSLNLKVFKIDDGMFYVENSIGKICYRVNLDEGVKDCTCPDYQKHINRDPDFRCKHLIAVLNSNGDSEQVKFLKRHKPKLDKKFITQFQGKDFVLYSGLLDLAHQKGILSLNVDVEQFPSKDNDNVAICRASVESVTGELYVEWGDANPKNVNRMVAAHIMRMAATRAKARVLRDFTNIGMTCMEELGGSDDADKKSSAKSTPRAKPVPRSKPQPKSTPQKKPNAKPIPIKNQTAEGKPSIAQLKAIENLAARRGINPKMLEGMAVEQFGCTYKSIMPSDAACFIRYLQKSA